MNNRILVIDDNKEIHDDIKKILCPLDDIAGLKELGLEIFGNTVREEEMVGISIDSAFQGAEGVDMGFKAWKNGNPYSVVFVDVRMPPGIDGIKTIQKLKQFDTDLQIVIITAYSDYSWNDMQSVHDAEGNLLILKKPFDSIEIRQIAHTLMEKWELSKSQKKQTQKLISINQDLELEIDVRKKLEDKQNSLLAELKERLKELNCLYELTKLNQNTGLSLEEIFSKSILFIPPAWQYPEHTCARIVYKEQIFSTKSFIETPWKLSSKIKEKKKKTIGRIDIFYTEEKPDSDEGKFLKEERALINAICEHLGETIEKIKIQKLLEENKEQLQLLMDSTAEGIFGLNLEGNCTFCNRSSLALLGYSQKDDLLEKSLHNLIHHTRIDGSKYHSHDCQINSTIKTESKIHSDEEIFWKKDGSSFQVEYWSYPIYKKNVITGIVVTFIDISDRILAIEERKKLFTQLQQAQKMEAIGTLAGGIAHDFNNILFPILGHTELLIQTTPEDSSVQDSLDEIFKGSLRAQELVKQILTFSRQEINELILMKLQPIVKEALKLIRSTIPTTIEIKQNINPKCGVVKADPTQIHQIVMNLATNAHHAMKKNGGKLIVDLKEVEIETLDLINPNMTPGVYARLTIADTGVGMDKNLTDKIFEPFFTTKEIGKGTGMGLSVVHGIVKNMNGAIQVYSEPGKGTEFHIYLPVVKRYLAKQKIKTKQQIPGGTEQVLFVDDEEMILKLGKKFLTPLGYKVTSHISSLAALESFRANPDKFDLVITDMTMPKMTGKKLAIELTKIRSDIPILLCTGFSETICEERESSIGIRGFLMKPIVLDELATKIREVLDEKRDSKIKEGIKNGSIG